MHRSMSRLLMSYDNPILRYDIKAFARAVFEASAAGVMVGARWCKKIGDASNTTENARAFREELARAFSA